MRFDFFVNNEYIIEFDGQQHFYWSKGEKTWNNKENYLKTKKYDNIKNNWCMKNNIPLIRIPYYDIDNISIIDLIPLTSKYLYQGGIEEENEEE